MENKLCVLEIYGEEELLCRFEGLTNKICKETIEFLHEKTKGLLDYKIEIDDPEDMMFFMEKDLNESFSAI